MTRYIPSIFILFAVLYFPFVYYGQLSMSASFMRADASSGIVNYIGSILNISALVYLSNGKYLNTVIFKKIIVRFICVWFLLVLANSIINASDLGRVFKDFNYGTLWVSHFVVYYALARNGRLNAPFMVPVFILLLLLAICMTGMAFNALMISKGGLRAASFNAVYFVICLLPWVFLIDRKWLKLAIIFIAVIAVLFSQKRTAILALVLQMGVYLLAYFNSKKGVISKIIVIGTLSCCLIYLFQYVNDSYLDGGITSRFEGTENDDMGGRAIIWPILLSKYEDSSTFYKLFGHGCESFLSDGGIHLTAHNDYLETLYDYGLINLIVLLFIVAYFLLNIRHVFKYSIQYGIAYSASLIAFMSLTMSSHLLFIHPCSVVFVTSMLGYVLGKIERKRVIL